MHKKRSHLTYLTFIKYLSIIFYDKVAGKIFDVNCAIINAQDGWRGLFPGRRHPIRHWSQPCSFQLVS